MPDQIVMLALFLVFMGAGAALSLVARHHRTAECPAGTKIWSFNTRH